MQSVTLLFRSVFIVWCTLSGVIRLSPFPSFAFTFDTSNSTFKFLINFGQTSGPSCCSFRRRIGYLLVGSVLVTEDTT